uniref:Uncharacterized protein n=1 Tax=Aureoumbra lagunensis TaxID=44058 RepID=A0A7S3JWS6_9STRA|mmetsp:Transcript_7209/g.10736  ORF Transcript_7209/g.10736 Transcript_7209/m.10736 type:complete len:362 (+) Transcript_7209:643-1728(+)
MIPKKKKTIAELWDDDDDDAKHDETEHSQKENSEPISNGGERKKTTAKRTPPGRSKSTSSAATISSDPIHNKRKRRSDVSSDIDIFDTSQWDAIIEQSAVQNIRKYQVNTSNIFWLKTGKDYYAEPRKKMYDWRPGYALTEDERHDLDLPEPVAGNLFCQVFDDTAFFPWDSPKEMKRSDTRKFGVKDWNTASRQGLQRNLPPAEYAAVFERGAIPALQAAFQNEKATPNQSSQSSDDTCFHHGWGLDKNGVEEEEYDYTDDLRPIFIKAVGRSHRRLIDLILEPKLFTYRQARDVVARQNKQNDDDSHLYTRLKQVIHEALDKFTSQSHTDILRTASETLEQFQQGTLISYLRELERGKM